MNAVKTCFFCKRLYCYRMETKMIRELALAVLLVVALYSVWAFSLGWGLFVVSIFDFWAFMMIFLTSAHLLYRWDEHKHRSFDD